MTPRPRLPRRSQRGWLLLAGALALGALSVSSLVVMDLRAHPAPSQSAAR